MRISLIQIPYVMGHVRVGPGRGPERLIEAGAHSSLERDGHVVHITTVERDTTDETNEIGAAFELSRLLAAHIRKTIAAGEFPLLLAGECTVAMGSVAALEPGRTGVVWMDAHGDFNTPETTESGYLYGMPLAAIVGRCWRTLCHSIPGFHPVPESQIVLMGARALDTKERELLEQSAVTFVSGTIIREKGLDAAFPPALERLAARADSIYLHVDVDVLDPSAGRANVYEEPGGLALDELVQAVKMVGRTLRITCATLSAYDPTYDADGRVAAAGIETLQAIAEAVTASAQRY